MVAVWEASAAMAPVMLSEFRPLPAGPEITALIRLPSPSLAIEGLPPESAGFPWRAPMKLRAMLTPTLAAPALPLSVAAIAAETRMVAAAVIVLVWRRWWWCQQRDFFECWCLVAQQGVPVKDKKFHGTTGHCALDEAEEVECCVCGALLFLCYVIKQGRTQIERDTHT